MSTHEVEIERLTELLRSQPSEVAAHLLRVLRERTTDAAPSVDRLTGIVIAASGEALLVVDPAGHTHTVAAGADVAVAPVLLAPAKAAQAPSVREASLAGAQALPSSALFVEVRAGGGNAQARIDAAGLYRNWAKWGPMQVVARRSGSRGSPAGFEVIEARPVQFTLGPGEVLHIVGVGVAPRLDPARIFGGLLGRSGLP